MAIDIEWQVMPPHNDDHDGKPRMFPRIIGTEVIGDAELAKLIAAHSGLSRGTVTTVLEDLADVVASLLREGKGINLSQLGCFRLSIGTDAAVFPDTPNSSRAVRIRSVNFQPNNTLLQSIGKPQFRQTARNAAIVALSATELLPQLATFMQSRPTFTSAEFARYFHLKRTTAIARLNELIEMGVIRREGSGKETKYRRGVKASEK